LSESEFDAMSTAGSSTLTVLPVDRPIWDRFFHVFPLVIIGSKEPDGRYNLAPKHMAMPLGWENHYCFVCSSSHRTYHNIRRHGVFTVSYPRPTDVLFASLAAAPRCEDQSKPSMLVLPTFPAREVDGVLVKGSYLFLECTLDSIFDGFGSNSLITGKIIAAAAEEDTLRSEDVDDSDRIFTTPLLAYLSPGRFAEIRHSHAFPFPKGFSR
jgi:flavin reductase (DIM6/NTAB) family NADH-FMN oxidoreductase RutF